MFGPMGDEFSEASTRGFQLLLVVIGLVPGNGFKGGFFDLGGLNLVGGVDLGGKFLFGTIAKISGKACGDDKKAKPYSQVIFFRPEIRPATLAVINNDVCVCLSHEWFLLDIDSFSGLSTTCFV